MDCSVGKSVKGSKLACCYIQKQNCKKPRTSSSNRVSKRNSQSISFGSSMYSSNATPLSLDSIVGSPETLIATSCNTSG